MKLGFMWNTKSHFQVKFRQSLGELVSVTGACFTTDILLLIEIRWILRIALNQLLAIRSS